VRPLATFLSLALLTTSQAAAARRTPTVTLEVWPSAVGEMQLAAASERDAARRAAVGGGPRAPRPEEVAPPWIEPGEALRLSLDQADRALGLGPAGAVLSAVRPLVQGADVQGEATLIVGVDTDGRVRAVDVRDVADPALAPAWLAIAAELAEGPPLSLRAPPRWARGAWIAIHVDARDRTPTGNLPGRPIEQLDNGISFDVTDVGNPAARVVRTRVEREEWR
jgi:hypothetical protein